MIKQSSGVNFGFAQPFLFYLILLTLYASTVFTVIAILSANIKPCGLTDPVGFTVLDFNDRFNICWLKKPSKQDYLSPHNVTASQQAV